MKISMSFPTLFAVDLAKTIKLIHTEKRKQENFVEWDEARNRLAMFQQMSIHSNFEGALTVYFHKKFDDAQIKILKLIHEMTKDWIYGHVAGELMDRLNSINTDGKDVVGIAAGIIKILENEGEITSNDANKLILNLHTSREAA